MLGTSRDNTYDCIIKGRKRWGITIGEANKSSKLTRDEILQIRELSKNKIPQEKIADMFNVHRTTIQRVVYLQTWKHVN